MGATGILLEPPVDMDFVSIFPIVLSRLIGDELRPFALILNALSILESPLQEEKFAILNLYLPPNISTHLNIGSSPSNLPGKEAESEQRPYSSDTVSSLNTDTIGMQWLQPTTMAGDVLQMDGSYPMAGSTSTPISVECDPYQSYGDNIPITVSTALNNIMVSDSTTHPATLPLMDLSAWTQDDPICDQFMPDQQMEDHATCDQVSDVATATAAYPTPSDSYTPGPANYTMEISTGGSLEELSPRAMADLPESTPISFLEADPSSISHNEDPMVVSDLGALNETQDTRLDLLQSLVSHAGLSKNVQTLREIYQLGDSIIHHTAAVLDDWNGWLLQNFPSDGLLLPPCHSLSLKAICASMSQFLMKTNNDMQRKSIHRRLARILLHVCHDEYDKELDNASFNPQSRKSVTVAHDSIVAQLRGFQVNGKECTRKYLSDNRNLGKRWWRLGSGIGIIHVLACAPRMAKSFDNRGCKNRGFDDASLELLVNYLRNAYPDAIAYFQSLDVALQALVANSSLATDDSVAINEPPDHSHLHFNGPPESIQWVKTDDGFPSHNFYIHPKRDILWLSENRVHDHLPTLRHSYGDLITTCTNILVDRFSWDDEKLRDDTLRSLKLLSAIECILILDDTVRLVEEDDGTYLVPDRDKIIARANRYRTEYEHFVKSLEKQNEVEGKDIRCGNPRRVLRMTAKLEDLRLEIDSKIKSMELNKNFLENTLSQQLQKIQQQRDDLDLQEKELRERIVRDDCENKKFIGDLLEDCVNKLFDVEPMTAGDGDQMSDAEEYHLAAA
ncbi:uncharacterized protein BHQ10_010340 [Talaromyces amestolkiae]|uniref:Uncharacterized protein n=1 Tax=Talaromyces amestolkiae TaxID=1196081 RepID=A0A364LET7_TALAM|nr:uncharacterized protein BHQ10_010340 [Talaromyces amestolkiae]RAO74328.1 hypothetical protein BHQ10_010340 [Talaromyces amestolkiae]